MEDREKPDCSLSAKSDGPFSDGPFLLFAQDLSIESVSPSAAQLAPALTAGSHAVAELMRARPALARRLSRGDAVSLLLDSACTGAAAVLLSLFARKQSAGYWGALTLSETDPALRENLTFRLREPITEVFALLPMLSKQLEAGQDPSVLLRLNECCYQLLRDTSLLSRFSRLVTGSWHPTQTSDLCSAAAGVCSAAASVLLPGQPPLRWALPERLLPVRCPGELLSTMICALLANALRFTRDGNEVVLSLTALEGRVLLRVRDHGTGIRPEVLPRIFEPFFSADPYEDAAPAPGAGLGLAFVQALAGRMGGTVSVESVLGEGSLFAVSLPLNETDASVALFSAPADYLLNRYSPVYLQLADFCRLPDPH